MQHIEMDVQTVSLLATLTLSEECEQKKLVSVITIVSISCVVAVFPMLANFQTPYYCMLDIHMYS